MDGRTFRVGVYLDVSRQYGREVAIGIADYAAKTGRWEFAGGGDVSTLEAKTRAGRLDGIIARIPDESTARRFASFKIPIVDMYGQCRVPGVSSVECDNEAISRFAADWFISRRFTNFAFVGFKSTPFSDARRDGFRRAVAETGCRVAVCEMAHSSRRDMSRLLLEPEKLGAAPDERRLVRFLKSLPDRTGVFCANDARAYQVLHAADAADLKVPDRVAVMGVDDDLMLCMFSSPGITSIDPNAREVGRQGARLLEALMRDRALGSRDIKTRHRKIPPRTVVERGSTDFDPIDPPWLRDVVRFMREHMSEGVNASDAYNHAGVSHTTLEAAFRTALGCSPHKFLSDLRLSEAMRLLRETDLSSAEVAARTGFASEQYFCRLFSSRRGKTPGEWRKMQKVQSELQ